MKNSLLLTTALVALASAAHAETKQIVINHGETGTVSQNVDGYTATGDKAYGAVYNIGGELIVKDGVIFSNNTIDKESGAAITNGIYETGGNEGGKATIGNNVQFNNNNGYYGGAVYNNKGNMTFGNDVEFNNNSSQTNGGAMVSDVKETVIFGEDATFFGNNAKGNGGAVSIFGNGPDSKFILGKDADFENNTAGARGGALNINSSIAEMSDADFKNNTAGTEGGAIYIGNGGDSAIATDLKVTASDFEGNKAQYGGAIYNNASEATLAGDSFVNNTAEKGGAIYNRKGTMTITGSSFSGNKATKGDGGALFNAFDGVIKNLTGKFVNNSATGRGGAIYNTGTSIIENITAVFEGNSADKGGAISNAGVDEAKKGSITISDSTFRNNTSTNKEDGMLGGGAIHNMASATINLKGNNVFEGNKANGKLNDIYNNGIVNVSGKLALDGGVSGNGQMVFAENSQLVVNAGTTTITNEVINNGASLEMIFANGYNGGEYELVSGTFENEDFDISNNNNALFDIAYGDKNGTYVVSKKSAEEFAAATGANANQAATVTAFASGSSDSAAFNTVANAISGLLQSSDKAKVAAGLNAATAVAPETSPMVQGVQSETSAQIFNAVSTRMTGGAIAPATKGAEGMSSGDSIYEKIVTWVQGLFNKSDLENTSKAKGFSSETYGLAMGAEKQIDTQTKAGAGYAYSNSEIDGFLRSTDVDTHTLFVYGEYKPSNWYVNAIASYGWSDYSEDKYVAGYKVGADYDVESFGLQAMTGYEMEVKGYGVTPEVGFRYVHIAQDGYRDSADQKVSANDSDIFTGVLGVKASKEYKLENNMILRPEVRMAVTYDMFTDDGAAVVTLPNGASYRVEGDALNRFGMEFGAGVTADVNEKVEVSFGYEGKFRNNYEDHTGLLSAKYKF